MHPIMEPTNIFRILNVKRVEDPHDRMLEWLFDPAAGHGVPDLAAAIISCLWQRECSERVNLVKRPFNVGEKSWPDLAVQFETALLLIENKVNASAFQEGQIKKQHELAIMLQKGAPLFHCLLCPDRMVNTVVDFQSDAFRVLPYSVLVNLISARSAQMVPQAGLCRLA